MVFRCIAPDWLMEKNPHTRKVLEGEFSAEKLTELNQQGYNIYFLPNSPGMYVPGKLVDGSQIDTFTVVFVDMDLKDGTYKSKEDFLKKLQENPKLLPSFVVDSGNGVHAYWSVSDLDAMSYLRLQRRLMRVFKTDEAVGQIFQLMRAPGYFNTKNPDEFKLCDVLIDHVATYTCEDLDKMLPPITANDEQYCKQHYNRTLNKEEAKPVSTEIPQKFLSLINENAEVSDIWTGKVEDRSAADYRLGHILFNHNFTRQEAMSVLVNTAKARERAPAHQLSYAENIVEKVWTFEDTTKPKDAELSQSVADILQSPTDGLLGAPFRCSNWIDNTKHGFRLGQVIGLVGGAGVGKTTVALNMFHWFVKNHPDKVHFFVSLEQPRGEIAVRWKTVCENNTLLFSKVHIIDNYDEKGNFRNLGLEQVQSYIVKFQEQTGQKVGCVVIDHIGVLKKSSKDGRQSIEDICHKLKPFAQTTNTLLVIQSQAPREKASIGDVELDKDAAYGTVFFEAYVDYLITIWSPLKRCYYDKACPRTVAFKYCKIRHKSKEDVIQEDERYMFFFDAEKEQLRFMTEQEEKAFAFWNGQAVARRKQDKKTDVLTYKSMRLLHEPGEPSPDNGPKKPSGTPAAPA